MKHYFGLVVLLVLLSLVFAAPLAAQDTSVPPQVGLRPDAPTYALHGPYWVGTIAMNAETEFHRTKVRVWYPARNPDGKPESVTYQFSAAFQSPIEGHAILRPELDPQGGPYPLVIFVHGLGGGNSVSASLCEHLASEGFMVMAIDYADSFGNNVSEALPMFTRPKDVSWQIDYAEQLNKDENSPLQGMIDLEHIVVVGYSYGGYTTLVAGGALLDLTGQTSWCLQYPNLLLADEFGGGTFQEHFCNDAKQVAELAGLQSVPEGVWPSWADARIDALVPLAPILFFGSESAKTVTIPTMLMFGSKDRIVNTEFALYQPYAYDNLGSTTKSLIVFEGADHNIFGFDCIAAPWLVDADAFGACSDPVWDMYRAHDLVNHFTTAFLLDVLKGDKDAHAALLAENVSFPGITYDTTMK